MSKDPFQILADEITLARQEIQKLQRTSLNRDEAEDLNQVVTKAQADILEVGVIVEKEIKDAIENATYAIRGKTEDAARRGAVEAILGTRDETLKVARDFSQATGEARQQAWRYFGGFWVWLLSMLALGAFIGLTTAMALQDRANAREFRKNIGTNCISTGGEKGTTKNGQAYCVFWMN